jgi:small subunit ribosomal protein S16
MGSKKRPFYRIIAADSRMPRDGRFIETLGFYNPVVTPAEVKVDEGSVFKWFERGAIPTTGVASLLRQLGYMQKWKLMKQGGTGEEVDARVAAIVAQQEKALVRRESKKKELMSEKAKAKKEEEAKKEEAQAAEQADVAPAEAAESKAAPSEVTDSDNAAGEAAESETEDAASDDAPETDASSDAPEETKD